MNHNIPDLDEGDCTPKFSDYFSFVSVLGNGAFGLVVEAKDKQNENEISAVKIIKKNSLNTNFTNGFRKEAFILSQFKHPNIVKFKKIIETETRFFLIMECIYGGQLKALIEQRNQNRQEFTEEEVSLIIRSIASAVEYIHRKGAIHRDLKPENILLSDPQDFSSLKVVDFGLSVHYDTDPNRCLTEQCGTRIYMAPELFSRTQYSRPIDIWSLGIITYQLLNYGSHPFYEPRDSFENYKRKVLKCKITPPEHCSDFAKQLLMRMLALDPTERYSAVEILKHPWITRRFTDQVPLTLNEQFDAFYHKQAIMRVIKTIAFIKTLQKINNADNLQTKIAGLKLGENLLVDSLKENKEILFENETKPSTPLTSSNDRPVFRIQNRNNSISKIPNKFSEISVNHIKTPKSNNEFILKGRKLSSEVQLFSPKTRAPILAFPNKSIYKRDSPTPSDTNSKDSFSPDRDSNSINSGEKLVFDEKSQISTGDSEKGYKRSRFSSTKSGFKNDEIIISKSNYSNNSQNLNPAGSTSNLATNSLEDYPDRGSRAEQNLETNHETDLPLLKQTEPASSSHKSLKLTSGDKLFKIVKGEELHTPIKSPKNRAKFYVDTTRETFMNHAQIFKPSEIIFSFNPHKRGSKIQIPSEKVGFYDKGRHLSMPHIFLEANHQIQKQSQGSIVGTPRILKKRAIHGEGCSTPTQFTPKNITSDFFISSVK